MTQNANVWEVELYRYIIDDAGAITGLTDVRQYLRPAVEMDHGQLVGLADDDHTQYYNAARQTNAVHNALGIDAATVGGFTAAALMCGIALGFKGVTVLWGGTIGGSDGHRPIDVISGTPNEDWHLANGQLVNGVQTLDSRNRVPIGAGDTYAVNASGGAATVDSSHDHAAGTLAAASHTHAGGTLSTNNAGIHTHMIYAGTDTEDPPHDHGGKTGNVDIAVLHDGSGGNWVGGSTHKHIMPTGAHQHPITAVTAAQSALHTHSITSGASAAATPAVAGNTATGGSVALAILPPYRAWYYIVYVG